MVPRLGARHLVLIGLRGCGKTTVGRELARRLGRPFVDVDDEIARLAHADVDALLREQGERAFREVERRALRGLVERPPAVIATGGGAVLGGAEFAALADPALVVWLDVPVEVLVQRAAERPRPALTGLSVADEFVCLERERRPLYAAAADMVLGPADGDPILVLSSLLDPRSDDEP